MADEPLPVHVDPFHLAAEHARLKGSVPVAWMERVAEAGACAADETVRVEMAFSPGPGSAVLCRGQLTAGVTMVCQRCLGSVALRIDRDLEIALVHSDAEAARVWKDYETYEVEGHRVHLWELVEEELLLALPLVPMHDETMKCGAGEAPTDRDSVSGETERGNPFKVLEGFRGRTK